MYQCAAAGSATTYVPDSWDFDGGYPCLYHGGYYNQSQNQRLEDENKRQNHRLDALERTIEQVAAISTSVEKLALNMENMLKEQVSQGKRLETLESRDGEMWRKVVGYVITTIIGIVVGYFFNHPIG